MSYLTEETQDIAETFDDQREDMPPARLFAVHNGYQGFELHGEIVDGWLPPLPKARVPGLFVICESTERDGEFLRGIDGLVLIPLDASRAPVRTLVGDPKTPGDALDGRWYFVTALNDEEFDLPLGLIQWTPGYTPFVTA